MEDAAVRASDLVWMAGEVDRASLAARYADKTVVNVPNGVEPMPDLSLEIRGGRSAFTYGSWEYEPNRRGLLSLATASVTSMGEFHVFGKVSVRTRHQVEELVRINQPHVKWFFRGFEPEFRNMVRTGGGVGIVPVWQGAGTKLRTVQLAAMGIPVCLTDEALSGLPSWFREHVRVENDPGQLLATALEGSADGATSARELRDLVNERLSWEPLVRAAVDADEQLSSR
jgi:hypothetical protein